MKKTFLYTVIFLSINIFIQNLANSNEIKLAVLKYGTVNWELNVIKHYKLDEKFLCVSAGLLNNLSIEDIIKNIKIPLQLEIAPTKFMFNYAINNNIKNRVTK